MAKPKAKYYAVAKGHRPGIYTDWSDCSAQVIHYRGSTFKGHQTLEAAKYWMCEVNAGQYAVVVQDSATSSPAAMPKPEPGASRPTAVLAVKPSSTLPSSQGFRSTWKPYHQLSQEFKLELSQNIQASRGIDVKPHHVEQEYDRRRTRAMHDALQTRFFKGSTSNLDGYQALCRAARIEPSDTIQKCRDDLRGTLVNIVDLLEALEFDEPVKVWPHKDWAAFTAYTKKADNRFNLKEAKKSEYLQCFLQKLAANKPHRFGNPKPLRSLLKPVLTSPGAAEIKDEDYDNGMGRLSPLASECIYDDDDADTALVANQTRKRGYRDMADMDVGSKLKAKRIKFEKPTQDINAFRFIQTASDGTEDEFFENMIQSGQGDNPIYDQ